MQGLTVGHIAVIGSHQQKDDLRPTKKWSVKIWIIPDWKDMVFSPKNKWEINLGVTEEEYATSINDELARKITSVNSEQVAHNGQCVEEQEYSKKYFLHLQILCEAWRPNLLGSIWSVQELSSHVLSCLPTNHWR